MSRKEKSLLNEIAAQLFPFCAEALLHDMDEDSPVVHHNLPVWMGNVETICQRLLPADRVYVAQRINQKVEVNCNVYDDDYVIAWFAEFVLDFDDVKEFAAQYKLNNELEKAA